MHELSIASGMVELAEAELEKHPGAKVLAIHLKLGRLCGVVREALEFSYEIACQSTALEGSKLIIEDVPVRIQCPQCQEARDIVSLQSFRCAVCGTPSAEILQGRDILVSALEIAEDPALVSK